MDLTLALASRAREMQSESTDPRIAKTSELMAALAQESGTRLRRWLVDRQKKILSMPDPAERWIRDAEGGVPADTDVLHKYHALDRKFRVERDARGNPVPFDPVDVVERMAYWVVSRPELSRWEKLPAAKRRRHLGRVEKTALDLAKLLEALDGPDWPPAIDLFDQEYVAFPPLDLARAPRYSVAIEVLRRQRLSEVLSGLASRARMLQGEKARDKRVDTSDANRRVLARALAEWFEQNFGVAPNEVIADVLNAVTPELPAVDAVAVRSWRGVK